MRFGSMKLALAGIVFLTLALAVACGSSSSPTQPVPPVSGGGGGGSANQTVTILGMNGSQSFSPNPVTVAVGQTIVWHNNDSISHTATANNGSFDTGVIGPGATSSPMTMTTAGTFSYHCSIHPSMVGTVTVTQ